MSIEVTGKITFLRVHDVGTKYGSDALDVDAVIQLDNKVLPAYGFQLRTDTNQVARQGMLDLLRDAYAHSWPVTIDYDIPAGKQNGVLFRVALVGGH
jgi:hypothetical protein